MSPIMRRLKLASMLHSWSDELSLPRKSGQASPFPSVVFILVVGEIMVMEGLSPVKVQDRSDSGRNLPPSPSRCI